MEIFNTIMGALGGVSAVLVGLFVYLGNLRLEKYKSELDIAKAKIQALTDTSSHVGKAQFDKEFSIYQEIWICLVKLRAKTLSLRPTMDFIDPKEPEDERMQRRLNDFSEAFYAFRDSLENHKPFYSLSVYEVLKEVFELCHEESIEYQYKEPGWSKEYWQKSRENNKKIVNGIDGCCEKIRKRISSLAVVE